MSKFDKGLGYQVAFGLLRKNASGSHHFPDISTHWLHEKAENAVSSRSVDSDTWELPLNNSPCFSLIAPSSKETTFLSKRLIL